MTESEIAVIIERLDNLKIEYASLKKEFDTAQERAEKWREKFDTKLDNRPCQTHSAFLLSIKTQIAWIWGIITVLLSAIIAEWVKK